MFAGIRKKLKKRRPNLPDICSRLSGTVQWRQAPADDLRRPCELLLHSLIRHTEQTLADTAMCTVVKRSYRKLILRRVEQPWQLYFKIYLPDFSLKWGRGIPFATPPSFREADMLNALPGCGVGAVRVIGTATLPWRRISLLPPVTVLITASKSHIHKLKHPSNALLLAGPQERMDIALKIIRYAGLLHKHGYGNLDMHGSNILFDPEAAEILMCDLERMTRMRPWNRSRRITQDYRKIFKAVSLLLDRAPGTRAEQMLMDVASMQVPG